MIKYTRLGYVWRLCRLFKYFNQLPNIRELYIRLFGEESVWEGALLSPILPKRMDSVFGQNLWLEKTHPGVRLAWVPALLPTLRIYGLEQVTNLHGLVSSYVKWGWLSPLWRIVMIRSERTCVRYAWNTVSGSCHHYSNRSKLAWSNPVTCETFSWIVAQNIFVVDVFFRHLFPYQSLLLTEFPVFTLLCSSRFCKRAFPRASFAFRIKGVLECVFWHEVKFIVS